MKTQPNDHSQPSLPQSIRSKARHLVDLNLKWTAVLLTSLAFLGSVCHAASDEGTGQEILAAALKKSNAKQSYRFEKTESWKGPLFLGISVSGSSSTGIFIHPHVTYSKLDGGKITRENYWIDGFQCTREAIMSPKMSEWKIVPTEAPGTVLSYPFDISDVKSFTVKAAAKNAGHSYVVEPTEALKQAIASRLLTEVHGIAILDRAHPEIDWKKSSIKWTVVLEPKTHLIREIEQQIEITLKPAPALDKLKNEMPKEISTHITNLRLSYEDKIKVELPDELAQLLKQKRENQ